MEKKCLIYQFLNFCQILHQNKAIKLIIIVDPQRTVNENNHLLHKPIVHLFFQIVSVPQVYGLCRYF